MIGIIPAKIMKCRNFPCIAVDPPVRLSSLPDNHFLMTGGGGGVKVLRHPSKQTSKPNMASLHPCTCYQLTTTLKECERADLLCPWPPWERGWSARGSARSPWGGSSGGSPRPFPSFTPAKRSTFIAWFAEIFFLFLVLNYSTRDFQLCAILPRQKSRV